MSDQDSMDATTPSAQEAKAYKASQPYTQLRPDAPRYVVPPPNLDYDSGKPVMIVENAAPHVDVSAEFGNPAFLRAIVGRDRFNLTHHFPEWKYDHRRTAQKILPFLLLGPVAAAKDTDFVQAAEITMLVAVRSATAARLQAKLLDPTRFASSVGLETLTLDIDSPYDMITKLPSAIKAINDHLEQRCWSSLQHSVYSIPARVLVFCESGNDRSATLVTAYLMVLWGVGAVEAMQMVQSQRFCLDIGDGSKNMLQTFEDILRARRDVAAEPTIEIQRSQPQVPFLDRIFSGFERRNKRSHDSANEPDEDMEDREGVEGDGVGEGEAEGRTGQAPFQDG